MCAREFRVAYSFQNSSDHDSVTLMAFPLLDIAIGQNAQYNAGAVDAVNVIGFEVMVDGKPIESIADLRATRSGVNQTGVLKRHGLPVLFFSDLHRRLEGLSGSARAELIDLQQRFPVGKTVEVMHRYRPVEMVSFFS